MSCWVSGSSSRRLCWGCMLRRRYGTMWLLVFWWWHLLIIRWAMGQPSWSWVNLFLGIWLVISPFVLVLGIAAMWNNVILGIIVAAFALTNTYSKVNTPTGI